MFYVLVLYIFLQFSWWAYLIFNLNVEIVDLQKELQQIKNVDATLDFDTLLRNKLLMITGEGAVFLLLLFIGFRQVKKSFLREFAAAKQQKNFLLSVTHELNSPLASIKLYLQTLAKRQLTTDKQKQLINRALKDVERQSNLINNILAAAKLEDSSYAFYPQKTDLSARVRELIESHPQQTHEVSLEIEDEVSVLADHGALDSVIINLFENALKYSEAGTKVCVIVKRSPDFAVFQVADLGAGIEQEHRDKIFEKFFRTGDENTRKTRGTGLGLFLVKFFIEAAGGKITVGSNAPQGTVFTVNWPLLR